MGAGGAHPFEDETFVRGMLINEDQAVGRLGNDVGRGDLCAGAT